MTYERTTEIVSAWLGAKPYVLIELDAVKGQNFEADDDDYTVKIQMRYGGGIGRSGAFGVMATMLEQNGWGTTAPDDFDPDAED